MIPLYCIRVPVLFLHVNTKDVYLYGDQIICINRLSGAVVIIVLRFDVLYEKM